MLSNEEREHLLRFTMDGQGYELERLSTSAGRYRVTCDGDPVTVGSIDDVEREWLDGTGYETATRCTARSKTTSP